MSLKVLFWGSILMVLIVFTVSARPGLIYTYILSLQLDLEHFSLVGHSKKIKTFLRNWI